MSQAKDYYAALGLDKEATESDIKKAYRKLAMTCHPDKNPDDPQAKEKFQAISEAYSVLSDAEKKGKYDRGELDEDGEEFDMNDFMQAMFGDGFIFQMGGFSGGNFNGMFGEMDSDDTEEEEAEIIESFMEMNVKPYGKNGLRCMLCDKKFSTENLMAVHFSRRHREEAMEWAESMDGQVPSAMDEAMLMQMMMGAAMMGGGGMRGGRAGGGGMAFPLEFMMMMDDDMMGGGRSAGGGRPKVGAGGASQKKKKPTFGKKKSFQ